MSECEGLSRDAAEHTHYIIPLFGPSLRRSTVGEKERHAEKNQEQVEAKRSLSFVHVWNVKMPLQLY